MFAFKAFKKTNSDNILVSFNNFFYEIGKIYETINPLRFCYNGFHYCEMPYDIDKYFKPETDNIVYGLVEILGDVKYDIQYHNAITNKIRVVKTLTRNELISYCKNGIYETNCGDIFYFKNHKYHNTDGPAIIRKNGYQAWYQNGKLHREPLSDEPAIIGKDGYKWYVNGKLHRNNDLPAIYYFNGICKYYNNGKEYQLPADPDIDMTISSPRYT